MFLSIVINFIMFYVFVICKSQIVYSKNVATKIEVFE
jgi:hypothetical protein